MFWWPRLYQAMTLHLTQLFSPSLLSSQRLVGPCGHFTYLFSHFPPRCLFLPACIWDPLMSPWETSSHCLVSHSQGRASLQPHPKPSLLRGGVTFLFSESAGMKRPGSHARAQSPRAPGSQRVNHVSHVTSCAGSRSPEPGLQARPGAPRHLAEGWLSSSRLPLFPWTGNLWNKNVSLPPSVWRRWEKSETSLSGKKNCLSEAGWGVSHPFGMSGKELKTGHPTLLLK